MFVESHSRLVAQNWHVAQCLVMIRSFYVNYELRFERRLVKAWEGSPGVRGLELRRD